MELHLCSGQLGLETSTEVFNPLSTYAVQHDLIQRLPLEARGSSKDGSNSSASEALQICTESYELNITIVVRARVYRL